MQLILFDSLLWTMWISFSLSVGTLGVFVLFEDALIPDQIKRCFKYGKSAEVHQKSALNKLELPKSWFYQFYLFATIFYSYLLFSIARVYLFDQELPEFTRFLLNNVVGENRKARVPSESVFLALVLILLQVVRRLYECIFVSVYSSESKMHLIHYIYGTCYYFGVGLSVLAEANGLTDYRSFLSTSPMKWSNLLSTRHAIGIVLFVLASYLHNNSHHILASLRKDKKGKVISYSHVIPSGGLFELISCPHYFAEILIYIALLIVQCGLSTTWWLVVCFVVINQVIMGISNHQWYINKFPDYPKKRRAVIPFLI